mmetsp:Transcript_132701/g.383659  ORF Transcript_132701/g.383659 Transcript_132701/m.383659 type:complete len:310 (-) Transcript_132701:773-1702(-)
MSSSSPAPSERRLATRTSLPPYFSRSRAAWTQFWKPISPSSRSCGANFFAVAAASWGGMPKARKRSKTPASSAPFTSWSDCSRKAALGVSGRPSNRASNSSCARSTAAVHSQLRFPGADGCGAAAASAGCVVISSGDGSLVASRSPPKCCKKSASCLENCNLLSVSEASTGPNSRQCPGHFCTRRKASGQTCVSGSDSIQVRHCRNSAVLGNRRASCAPDGNRTRSCTTSAPASGSGPSCSAKARARSRRWRSRSAASRAAASSRAWRSSSARCSASVLSLGRTSTVRSVSRSARCGSGSNSLTTSSYV